MSEGSRLQRRKEKVEETIKEFQTKGYQTNDLSVSGDIANKNAMIIGLLPAILIILLFGLINGWSKLAEINYIIVLVCFIPSIIIHEGIHGFFYALFAHNHFKSIEFGVIWKSLNPYCYCREPLKRGQYCIALLMPGFILGCCTVVIGMLIGNSTLLGFGILNILTAGGDIYIAILILKTTQRGREEYYLDHPSQPGVLILAKE